MTTRIGGSGVQSETHPFHKHWICSFIHGITKLIEHGFQYFVHLAGLDGRKSRFAAGNVVYLISRIIRVEDQVPDLL